MASKTDVSTHNDFGRIPCWPSHNERNLNGPTGRRALANEAMIADIPEVPDGTLRTGDRQGRGFPQGNPGLVTFPRLAKNTVHSSSGSGHRSFTPATGVRFPHGPAFRNSELGTRNSVLGMLAFNVQNMNQNDCIFSSALRVPSSEFPWALVEQQSSSPLCQSGGRRFESGRGRFFDWVGGRRDAGRFVKPPHLLLGWFDSSPAHGCHGCLG